MPKLKVGEEIPDFSLPADTGSDISLKDLRGRRVVIYFYPKDDTPGCTRQSCEFRDLAGQFDKRNTVVLGVSRDNLENHNLFKRKYKLNFPLLVDENHKVHELFGAWGRKTSYGKTTTGAIRTVAAIDENGKLLFLENGIKPEGSAKKVLEVLN